MKMAKSLVLSMGLMAFVGQLPAMDVKIATDREAIDPITKWPLFLYAEAFPSLVGKSNESQEGVSTQLKQALSITKEAADAQNMEKMERVKLDWMYTLCNVEKEYLGKPFETLTIDDIKKIASWLSRLTVENPGSFRKHEAMRIETSLQQFLAEMKYHIEEVLKKNRIDSEERLVAVLDAAASVHTKIVEIRAFEKGSKCLGRMLMYIFLAQYRVEPMTFYSSRLYREKLRAVLTGNDRNAFKKHVQEAYIVSMRLRRNPSYFAILKDLERGIAPIALLNHPLQIAFEERGLQKKPEVKSTSEAHACNQCGRSSEIVPDLTLQRCSQCKTVFYCSLACQKKHWPIHKSVCGKNAGQKQ
jgi:hypothetical protein